jgi:hypothetical protein
LSAAADRQRLLPLVFEVEDEFDVPKPVQQAGVHDVHQMGEIQRAINALGPAAVAAKEFSSAAVPQQLPGWFFDTHPTRFAFSDAKTNRVNP